MSTASIIEHLSPWQYEDELLDDPELSLYLQPHWYAVYTRANHERKVADQLLGRGVDHFLPQYESERHWKDRKVRLQLPLFPGYLFVQLALRDRLRVLQVPGVVRLVGFDDHAVPVPQEEITRIRELLEHGLRATPHPYLQVGRRVRVVRGPLKGMEGVLVRRKNGNRFVISSSLIERSMAVDVGVEDII